MRIAKTLRVILLAGSALATASNAHGHRFYMSLAGPPYDLNEDGITEQPALAIPGYRNGRPEVTILSGETITIHQWVNPDGDGGLPSPGASPIRRFDIISYDIQASSIGVGQLVEFLFANPINEDSNPERPYRWDATFVDAVDTSGNATTWVRNATGGSVTTTAVTNNVRNGPHRWDQGRDDAVLSPPPAPQMVVAGTGDYWLGSLTLRGVSPGIFGLYFRVGEERMRVRNLTTVPIEFGHNDQVHEGMQRGAGDPITADLALADAIIRVCSCGPPDRINALSRFNDPETPDVVVPGPNGKQKVNIPFDSARGTLILQDWTQSSFLDVWLDIAGDDATVQAAMALLQAQANDGLEADGYQLIASPGQEFASDWPVDYDFRVRFDVDPSSPHQVFDFDFGATGIVVAHIGIPEPSGAGLAVALLATVLSSRNRKRKSDL